MPQPRVHERGIRRSRLRSAAIRAACAAGRPRSSSDRTVLVPQRRLRADGLHLRRLEGEAVRARGACNSHDRGPLGLGLESWVEHAISCRPDADPDRERRPRRSGRPVGHGLAEQRLLLDCDPRCGGLTRRDQHQHVLRSRDRQLDRERRERSRFLERRHRAARRQGKPGGSHRRDRQRHDAFARGNVQVRARRRRADRPHRRQSPVPGSRVAPGRLRCPIQPSRPLRQEQ